MTVDGDADFTTSIPGPGVAVTVAEPVSVTGPPVGGVPLAVAVFSTEPVSMSAWVTFLVAVHVLDPPGARFPAGHVMADRPGNGSVTPTVLSVTLPELVTRNEYVTTEPAVDTDDGLVVGHPDGVVTESAIPSRVLATCDAVMSALARP